MPAPKVEDVRLTDRAREKAARLLPPGQVVQAVAALDGTLYRDRDRGTYVLRHERDGERWHIVFDMQDNTAVVVTQMHEHVSLDRSERYRQVE